MLAWLYSTRAILTSSFPLSLPSIGKACLAYRRASRQCDPPAMERNATKVKKPTKTQADRFMELRVLGVDWAPINSSFPLFPSVQNRSAFHGIRGTRPPRNLPHTAVLLANIWISLRPLMPLLRRWLPRFAKRVGRPGCRRSFRAVGRIR